MPISRNLELQTQILKELTSPASFQWNARESYARIAKKLGMDEETVRLTVRRVMESGFVEKWRIIINPKLLGQESAAVQLIVDDSTRSKSQVISQLHLIDGVILIFDFHGRAIRIVFNYETEQNLKRKLALLQSICRCKESQSLYWITTSPACTVRLRKKDWEILKAIGKDPRRNLVALAAELKVSGRTVNRRLRAMIEGKAFYLIPVRNLKKSSGLLCNFIILHDPKSRDGIEAVLDRFRQRIDFVYMEKGLYNVSLMLDNITTADELAETLGSVHGVHDLKMNIVKDFIFVDEWLEDLFERKLRAV
jgi:DNA-binding Lrp family transcriptional regulator